MKEESRIEALEHELKILKNEIHTTLLEIREQILNHYYPELRAEEPLHHHSLPVRQSASRPGMSAKSISVPRAAPASVSLSEIATKGQVQPFSDVFLEDLTDDDLADEGVVDVDDADIDALLSLRRTAALEPDDDYDDDDDFEEDDDTGNDEEVKTRKIIAPPSVDLGVAPQTREVDFRQLKQATRQPTEKPTPERSAPMPTPKASRATFAALATWVSDGVGKVGKERTAQVVETYASGGKLTAETKSSLLQLISLAGEDEPAAPAGTQDMLAVMVGLDQILGQ